MLFRFVFLCLFWQFDDDDDDDDDDDECDVFQITKTSLSQALIR